LMLQVEHPAEYEANHSASASRETLS
jgi:hypothetical protein